MTDISKNLQRMREIAEKARATFGTSGNIPTCCNHDCNQGRTCPLRTKRMAPSNWPTDL